MHTNQEYMKPHNTNTNSTPHSNTTPQLANAIIGEKKFEQMHDEDNSSLFILTESEGKIIAERISVNY